MFRYKDYSECWFWKTCAGHLCWEMGPTEKKKQPKIKMLEEFIYFFPPSFILLPVTMLHAKTNPDNDTEER